MNKQYDIVRLIHKRIGKSIMLTNKTSDQLLADTEELMKQITKMERPETWTENHRFMERLYKAKQVQKYREDTVRHYDQKKMGFFVNSVLARDRISIPLR